MAKWSVVFLGFILTVCVRAFIPAYEFAGLLIIGFIVGYMAHSGIIGGIWNAALAGAFGTIIAAIIFIIMATLGGSMMGLFGGLTGFTISGFSSLFAVIGDIIYYMIVMGITGAIGGAISSKTNR